MLHSGSEKLFRGNPSVSSGNSRLLDENTPAAFWKLLEKNISPEDWSDAAQQAMTCLGALNPAHSSAGPSEVPALILGEGHFGPNHWRMSRTRRLYYTLRPIVPAAFRPILQRVNATLQKQGTPAVRWPMDDRYIRFQFATVRHLLESRGLTSVPYIHFWPEGKRFALVLTHDVEAARGQDFVRKVVELEEGLGFRSSFNFVPESYAVDMRLLAELRERGFEVGVHGLHHDGRLFTSEARFLRRAERVNHYLKAWGAVGFRSPMTHRQPRWMQALDIEYDASFFDTDPFEPIPGGTMSIWPFFIGRFVELPYTLAQDHTLTRTLGETTARLWLQKVAVIRQYCGMALVNSHPDYLLNAACWAVYEEFLQQMQSAIDFWHALPCEVARWWRERANTPLTLSDIGSQLPGGRLSVGVARLPLSSPGAPLEEILVLDN